MTSISIEHPYGIPKIELVDKGRKISFQRDCLEEVTIMRKVNDGEWETLAERIRSPYVDEDGFTKGTKLSYAIELEPDGRKKLYKLEVRL